MMTDGHIALIFAVLMGIMGLAFPAVEMIYLDVRSERACDE